MGYFFAGVGVLAKGPVALGLIGLIMLLYLVFDRKLNISTLKQLQIPLGGLLFLLIAVPWYVFVGQATDGEWTNEFFFKQNLSRFSSPMEGHGGSFWLTWLFVLLGLFPFGVFLPQSLHWSWKLRQQPFLKLCLIAASVIVGFFTLSSTKLPNYTVPAYPFLSVVLGYFLYTCIQETSFFQRYRLNWSLSLGLFISFILLIGGYFALQDYPLTKNIAAATWVFLPLVLGFTIGLFQQKWWIQSIASGTLCSSLLIFYILLPKIMHQNPVEHSKELLANRIIIAYQRFNPAYAFQMQRHIPVAEDISSLKVFLEEHPESCIVTVAKYGQELLPLQLDTLFIEQDLFEGTTTLILFQEKH
ncbi:MAG: hypothetical protein AAF738_06450 [Bacteroidota bacterium]